MSSEGDLDVQKLREEIAEQRRVVSTLDYVDLNTFAFRSKAGRTKIDLLASLAAKEERLELLLEHQRTAKIIREFEELHLPKTDNCPICLDEINVANSTNVFPCCGGLICFDCRKQQHDVDAEAMKSTTLPESLLTKCPLCRADFGTEYDANIPKWIKQHAKKGKPWAQSALGDFCKLGTHGMPVNHQKSFRWYTLAAEQKFPQAMCAVSRIYRSGGIGGGIVEQSDEKFFTLAKEAADLGNADAQGDVAAYYFGKNNITQSILYMTLAASQGDVGQMTKLGYFYFLGEYGMKKSMILSKHYLGQSASKGDVDAYYFLARSLFNLTKHAYEGRVSLPGHSCIPKVLYWARKAELEGQDMDDAAELVSTLERQTWSQCEYCIKSASSVSQPLKACSKCKAVRYCSKECQVQHWKEGHKIDCKTKL
ncbi:hypothetical protein ACHAWF_010716 [Thalassiosira exigua]